MILWFDTSNLIYFTRTRHSTITGSISREKEETDTRFIRGKLHATAPGGRTEA